MNETSTTQCSLADRKCVPCQGGTGALKGQALADLAAQTPLWQVVEDAKIARAFKFPDFAQALAFVNRVGALAEEQGHHPDICFTWGKVRIELSTHKVKGLSESDFILAAKIDAIAK